MFPKLDIMSTSLIIKSSTHKYFIILEDHVFFFNSSVGKNSNTCMIAQQ